jgi:hypothetical protein
MVGGGTDDEGTTFGKRVATIPARRGFEAVQRLVSLYGEQKHAAESPLAFFRRVDAAVVRARVEDLEALTPETATPDAFVDLAEEDAFEPVVMEGECSA